MLPGGKTIVYSEISLFVLGNKKNGNNIHRQKMSLFNINPAF